MDESQNTLSLGVLFKVLLKNLKFIIPITLVTTIVAMLIAEFAIQKQYSSSAMLYVENKSTQAESININDINVAQKLVNTCEILFTSDTVMQQLINDFGFTYSTSQMRNMISVSSINSTEVLEVKVTMSNPESASNVAHRLVDILQNEFQRVIESGTIKVVDNADLNMSPVSPNKLLFSLAGFMLGLLCSYVVFFIIEICDVKVKADDDLFEMYDIPVFAEIMDFETGDKSNYKIGYSYKY